MAKVHPEIVLDPNQLPKTVTTIPSASSSPSATLPPRQLPKPLADFKLYVDSKCCYHSVPLETAELVNVHPKVAYKCQIKILMEVRSEHWKVEPSTWNHETILTSTTLGRWFEDTKRDGQPIGDIWNDYNFQLPSSDEKSTDERALPHCNYSTRCDNCRGKGLVTCSASECGGSGDVRCTRCNGRGRTETATQIIICGCNNGKVRCSVCKGGGKVHCSSCKGCGGFYHSASLRAEWHTRMTTWYCQNSFLPEKQIEKAQRVAFWRNTQQPWSKDASIDEFELKEIREENGFNEIDLNHFQFKLTQITEEFLQPSNISIRQDSQEFTKKISVISSFEQIQTKKNQYKQFAITVAGGNEVGRELNQLNGPNGMCIDNNKSIYIVDYWNDLIVKCGDQNNQLNCPMDGNKRVTRYFDQNQINQQILIQIFIVMNHEVRRWKEGDEKGVLVAGGNGKGNHLNQLNHPRNIFIDEDYSLYISDLENHRVMKWKKDAKEGIIVAGGNGLGNSLKQLWSPRGVIVDHLGQIYVADSLNNRVMRWCEGDAEGEIVVDGNGLGYQSNQLNRPRGLSFDDEKNLYVADWSNHRIEKFEIIL
ncbi:unnamed protein product [Adineta steineri]|uniref:Uncharacterized protein n=1 Tax=Adineta steineri TaxID=433720 RepID=A0A815DTF2_9BILA|nr:unnamed protein product [Adineta steineri]CAF4023365.1 unnamed protein product [Adineta steineri]